MGHRLLQTENREKRVVHAPHLIVRQVPNQFAQALGVDRAELLDEDPGGRAVDLGLGPKRCGSCAPRRRRHDDDRAWQELVGLYDHPEAIPVLLVSNAARKTKAMDVTSKHATTP